MKNNKNVVYARKMREIFSVMLLVFFSGQLYSQVNDPVFKGNFQETPFAEFVNAVENSLPVRFFYDSVQVREIRITASGEALKLMEVLHSAFVSSQLKYYLDPYSNVIIYQGSVSIKDELPSFSSGENTQSIAEKPDSMYLTEAERKYLDGKATLEVETIVVGNRQQMVQNANCLVRGRMVVRETGEPLVGATIYLIETGSGAATDADGYFRLILKPGKYRAKAACVSMKEKPFNLEVYSDGFFSVRMEKATINLSEVTVSAERHDNVAGLQMGYEHVLTKNMKEIPVALGERDLLKVATLLPGVQTAGEGSSGLIVRGGTADQNLFYLNRIPVYNTSHLFGFFTSFSPDVVSDFTIYKSNIPAGYGGRVSSVFDITTRKGNKKKFYGQGGISPVTGHFELEGPVWKDKSSFVVSGRSSYSDWILSRMNDRNLKNSNANFYDVTAGLNTELNNNNLVKLFGYSSFDQFTLSSSDDYNYANNGASASWKHLFSSALTSDLSAVYSQYWFNHNQKKNPSEAYAHKYILQHSEVKADFTILTSTNHDIRFGAGGILYQLDRGTIQPYGEESTRLPVELGKEQGTEGALYFSDDFPITRKLSVSAGLRYSFYGLLGPGEVNEYDPAKPKTIKNVTGTKSFGRNAFMKTYSGPEVRVALNQRLGAENSLKASYNRLRQYLFMLSNTMAVSPDDQWKLADYYMKPPVCDQLSFGFYQDFARKGFSSSLEVYRKWTSNVVEYRDGISFISGEKAEMQLLQGLQDSYGLELMMKKSTGKTTGWLSYTYSKSSVVVKGEKPFDQINNGMRFPSNYDRPHSVNLVTNMRYSRRFSFSTNVVYSTGRPVTYPVAVYKYENKYLLYYSARNEYRLPDYFRVDCSVNMEGNLLNKKRIHSSWMLNVYNVTGRKNAYSVYFESDEGRVQGYKLSVFAQPVFTLSWNFKFGNYASE